MHGTHTAISPWLHTNFNASWQPTLYGSDYYLFPKLEEFMKGSKFADDEDVISKANGWPEEHDQQLQWSPSYGEMLDQVHFSCRRLC